ncbi:hypothetical protein GCM10028827_08270 [Mucilaginibacter myungsuensis]
MTCRKGEVTEPVSRFTGKWLFIHSVGGISGKDTVKPTGKWLYIFQKDSIFHRTNNDTLKFSGTYQVRSEQSIFTGQPAPVLRFNYNQQGGLIINLIGDTLILSDNHTEAYSSLYIRTK